jgi:hypothetical protein
MSQSDLSKSISAMIADTHSDSAVQDLETNAVLDIDLKVLAEKDPDLQKDHSKSHGLVWGEFKIEEMIPESLKVEIFAQPKPYPLWARVSNASEAEKRGKLSIRYLNMPPWVV